MKSVFYDLLSMASGLAGSAFAAGPVSPEAAYRYATPARRARKPGPPGLPGSKLGKSVLKRRLGLATLR